MGRGLSRETIDKFGLGFAPTSGIPASVGPPRGSPGRHGQGRAPVGAAERRLLRQNPARDVSYIGTQPERLIGFAGRAMWDEQPQVLEFA